MAGNKRAVRWKQSEATRAVKAAEAAGMRVERIECCPDGKIIVIAAKGPEVAQANEWDEVLHETPIPVRS
jgi:hypothetical protein